MRIMNCDIESINVWFSYHMKSTHLKLFIRNIFTQALLRSNKKQIQKQIVFIFELWLL